MKLVTLLTITSLSVWPAASMMPTAQKPLAKAVSTGKLSYESMLTLPRRSSATANDKGTKAVFTSSQYSFSIHKRVSGLYYVDIDEKSKTHVISEDSGGSNAVWLNEDELLFLKSAETTQLWIANTKSEPVELTNVGNFSGDVSDLKIRAISSKEIKFIVSGMSTPDDELVTKENTPKRYDTGRVYTSVFVRHWDTWLTENRNSLFAGVITRDEDSEAWKFGGKVKNIISRKHNLETPMPPYGATDHFDISPDGKFVAFVSKDPVLRAASYTTAWLYIVPFDGSKAPEQIKVEGVKGASSNPVYSPDGKQIAWTQMKHEAYESDQNRIYVLDVTTGDVKKVLSDWHLSVGGLKWAPSNEALDITVEINGRVSVFTTPLVEDSKHLERITHKFVTTSFQRIGDKFFVSSSSMTSPAFYSLFKGNQMYWHSPAPASYDAMFDSPRIQEFATVNGLSRSQVDEFTYQSDDGKITYPIHGWILKPSFFDESKKYPLAFLIHGGPQGSWDDSWNTRWNPAVFAERGYVVVAINPTGSTGYGQNLTDYIRKNWGGSPYQDLVNGYEYVLEKYRYIDADRTVALGASYGGYMVNWIQGNELGRKFKALVCHDGIFNTENQYATEELWFPDHEFGAPFPRDPKAYDEWNPASLIQHWKTPQFTIHNTLDYRIPESEGLAVFNVLQTLGVPSKFLSFPDENHWVLKPENSRVWHEEVFGFIDHYAKPEGS